MFDFLTIQEKLEVIYAMEIEHHERDFLLYKSD